MKNEEIKILDFSGPAHNASGDTYSTFQPTFESLEAVQVVPANLLQSVTSTSPHAVLAMLSNSQNQPSPDRNAIEAVSATLNPTIAKKSEKVESAKIVQELLKKRKIERNQEKAAPEEVVPKHERYKSQPFATPGNNRSTAASYRQEGKIPQSAAPSSARGEARSFVGTMPETNFVQKLVNKLTPLPTANAIPSTAAQSMTDRSYQKPALFSITQRQKPEQKKVVAYPKNVFERMRLKDSIRKETIMSKTLKSHFAEMSRVTGKPHIGKNSRLIATQSSQKVIQIKP